MSSCSGSIFTILTGIPYSFMLTFNMFLKATDKSGSIFTIYTGIPNSFVLTFNMFLQTTCYSCKKITGISNSFMFTFEMILEIRNRENNIFSVFRSRTEYNFFVLNEFDDLFTPETYFTISSTMVFYWETYSNEHYTNHNTAVYKFL